VGSSAILRSGGGYASNQAAHKVNHNTSNYSYSTNGRVRHCGDDQYYEINKSMTGGYGSGRKNCLSSSNNNNNYRGSATRLDIHGNDNGRPNNDTIQTDSVVVTSTSTTLSSRLSPSERINADASNTQEKPTSPPPAPYSPMTRPLPTLSPPTLQVQFYAPAQNRYQPSSMPLSQTQQQQQQQQSVGNQRSRYSVGQALSSTNRKPSDKYSSTTGSQATMLRQSKYKMNGIMQTTATTVAGKLADDALGGAGDGPGRLPITPPGTPRTAGHPAAGDQLSDTCHQMQALTL